jgi:ribosomal protein S18 acetylase RimI-like enzyme
MTEVLTARKGKHSLGYQSFYIARQKNTREVVGMLLLKTNNSGKRYIRFVDVLTIPIVVMMNLGLIGLFRTGRNWLILHRLSPKLKPNELHIAYLAVSDGARHLHVGRRLLNYAEAVASKEDKQLMTLCVREKNVGAQNFFLSHGFSVESVLPDEKADRLLGQGPSIRMRASV